MARLESSKWLSNSTGDTLTRRHLLASAFCAQLLSAQKAETIPTDLSLADGDPLPAELFFVREHFPQPEGLTSAWKLSVAGREFTVDDLTAQPAKTLPVTLECAENPSAGGLVSHATWTGVPLATLLPPNPAAAAVRCSSADSFSHSIPLEKALHPDTLVAYAMNGEKLPVSHGFPLRLIVPGWYGVASIKWLKSIVLLTSPDPPTAYLRQVKSLFGARTTDAVTVTQVKSAFTRPQEGATLMKRRFTLRGLAWSGESRIAKVEISLDGAATWKPATLAPNTAEYAWTPWSFNWLIPRPGEYSLAVRATDSRGNTQPQYRPADRVDPYENNGWQTIKVAVV